MSCGGNAKVLSSNGFHSKKYVGMKGFSVMKLSSNPSKVFWVLRFPSVLPLLEEGLFSEDEIVWLN
jgi:hypothetical protein